MKNRITLTIDPDIAVRAKQIAHVRKTSVSALVEDLIRRTPLSRQLEEDFAEKWAGKLRLRAPSKPDERFDYLKKRYGLSEK